MPATGNNSLLSYSLSIRQCADGFSFFVYSASSGQLLMQDNVHCTEDETLADALERGLNLGRIKGRRYERVTLLSSSPSTRVPLDEFRREDMLALYRLTFSGMTARHEDMRFQLLPGLEIVEIFALSSQVVSVMQNHYPSAVVKSFYGSLLEYVSERQQGTTSPVTYHAVVVEGGLFIVVLRRGKLIFANVFHAEHDADKLYFMLYVWKTLDLDAWHDSCTLYGASSELHDSVLEYLRNVELREINLDV